MRKGETFLGSILMLLFLLLVFAALVTYSGMIRPSPIVDEAFWLAGEEKVSTVHIGSKMEAHVVIRATGEYVGSVVVKIRKDIAFWLDKDYAIMTEPLSLRGDERTELALAFIPDKASTGNLRGYFIEVNFLVTRAKWVMENSYPPRLRIINNEFESVPVSKN